jgi:CheY-like chemotaxis protein
MKETLLFAEDDELLLKVIGKLLREWGYTVLTATNGDEAVDVFERNFQEIDMAILDVVMPKRDGVSVCRAIREMNPALPCLFSSGYAETGLGEGLNSWEDTGLILKPYESNELLSRVRELLDF